MASKKYEKLRKIGVKDMHNNDLLKACKCNKDLLGEFLQENRDFIFSILIKYKGNISELKYKFNIEEEELLQLAYIGILTALEDFQFERGVRFTTFVVRPILWEVNQFLYGDSQLIRLSRGAVDLIKKINYIENNLGYLPSEEELENLLNVSKERLLDTIAFTKEIKSIDTSDDFIMQNHEYDIEDEIVNKVYVHQLLNNSSLSKFELDVITLIKNEGINNSKIAKRLGVYPMTINRTLSRIKQKLENVQLNDRKVSKYEDEIKFLAEEIVEIESIISIEEMKSLLDVCGYNISVYTPRILYYIRQKSIERAKDINSKICKIKSS